MVSALNTYQVLARRYRPQTFADLVGQETVVRTLRNALATGTIAHAYVFSGLRGVGKTTAARILAKALNCEHGPTPDPCGSCVPCREIAEGSSMDVLEIDAASNRGIDNVRELREVARILPVRDRYRVFILDEAHQLTPEAFNALLKILEEPPPHVVFVLASTEKHKFPPTILSRCQQLEFRPLPVELIAGRLTQVAKREGFGLEEAAAHLIARAAQGSLRDALSILDQVRAFVGQGVVDEAAACQVLGLPPGEFLLALWEALRLGDAGQALALLAQGEARGLDPHLLYQQLLELLRSLTLVAANPEAPLPYPEGLREQLRASAAAVGLANLLRLLALAVSGRELVGLAPSPGLGVMVAVGKLALWPRLVRVEALLAGQEPPAPAPGLQEGTKGAVAALRETEEGSSLARFFAEVEAKLGTTMLARLRNGAQLALEGEELVVRLQPGPAATVKALQECFPQLATLATACGVAAKARLEVAERSPSLEERVQADPRVQTALKVFGGKITKVEERS